LGGALTGLLSLAFQFFLKLKTDREIEALKSQLARQNFIHSKVFVETEEVINHIYKTTVEINAAMAEFSATDAETNEEQANKAYGKVQKLLNDFRSYYTLHKLYIPKDTAKKVSEIMEVMWDMMANEVALNIVLARRHMDKDKFDKQREGVVKYLGELHKQLVVIQELLENDFQRILGFPE